MCVVIYAVLFLYVFIWGCCYLVVLFWIWKGVVVAWAVLFLGCCYFWEWLPLGQHVCYVFGWSYFAGVGIYRELLCWSVVLNCNGVVMFAGVVNLAKPCVVMNLGVVVLRVLLFWDVAFDCIGVVMFVGVVILI